MSNLIAAPLLGVLFLACCGVSGMAATCPENDLSCFDGYANDGCQDVKMKYTLDIPVDAEITGKDSAGNCKIVLTGRSESDFRSVMIDSGADPAAVDEYLSEVDYSGNIEGKSASCSVAPDRTYYFFTDGEGADTCSGPLMDGMMAVAR
ncbi:MAG TPA: hypothetical protein VLD37_03815 [Candidatus Bilamarchaeum sp.]|nr:hypothetical protein [Candidatus Bilamarchaeum sp.]